MKILFFAKHPGSTRNFESVLWSLAERGHTIHLAFESMDAGASRVVVDKLDQEFDSVSYGPAPKGGYGRWFSFGQALRLTAEYLRFLTPEFRHTTKLRARAASQAPTLAIQLGEAPLIRTPRGLRLAIRALLATERVLPAPPSVDDFISKQKPDLVLVTPLVGFGSRQANYIRGARRLGIHTGLLVHSWDNLTNKGLIAEPPDLVTVWNEAQAREAVELHRVPRDAVAVTGATSYDHWFDWAPTREREPFCSALGLRPDRPIVLYVCSSPFIAPDETEFVTDWVAALRSSPDPGLAEAGVIVRPHPQHADQWRNFSLGDDNAVIWPPVGADPVDVPARSDYFDSIFHSAAVVGVNTSAQIESAIVGRPVFTIVTDHLRESQEGTLHFQHLVGAGDGAVTVARSFEEHVEQLARAMQTESGSARPAVRFVEEFIRPRGIDKPATPFMIEAIEGVVERPPPDTNEPAWVPVARLALGPAADFVRARLREQKEIERAIRTGQPLPPRRRLWRPPLELEPALETQQKTVRNALGSLARDPSEQVLVGPWVGEVGYELLYWIPFLRWAVERTPGLAEKLVVVSRGGTASWYRGISNTYVDMYDIASPDEIARLHDEAHAETAGAQKRMAETELDEQLLTRVRERLGIEAGPALHTSTMFRLYWELVKKAPLHDWRIFSFHPFGQPESAELDGRLPPDYVTARFYFSAAFPDTDRNRATASRILTSLAEKTDVVLLNPGMRFDDHSDWDPSLSGNVHRIDDLMTPTNNLHLQSVAIGRSRAFVGTYGGLSYLAPLLGVPSLAVFSDRDRFRRHHLELAQRIFHPPVYGDFVALDTRQLDLLDVASVAAEV